MKKTNRPNTSLDNKGIKSVNEKPAKSYARIEKEAKERMEACSKRHVVIRCKTLNCLGNVYDEPLIFPSRCYIRICPTCKMARRWRLTSKYSFYLNFLREPRFLSLTLKNPCKLTKSNKKIMDRAFQEFVRELRKRGYVISKYIKGIEFKKVDEYLYRFHYHVIYDGSYIPQEELSKLWKKHSKGSFIVHIRRVYNKNHMCFYLTKYISKSMDMEIPLGIYASIRKMRFFNTYGFKGLIKKKKKSIIKCPRCGRYKKFDGYSEEENN